MPTTPAGAVLFLILFVPGFCYLFRAEPRFPSKYTHISVFRETVTVVFVSGATLLVVAAPIELLHWARPAWTPDIPRLLKEDRGYEIDHYLGLTLWCIGAVSCASALAFWAASSKLADRVRSIGADKSATFTSGWYATFELPEAGDRYKRVTCCLRNGTVIEGTLLTYNPAPDDDLERDLTLSGPLYIKTGSGEAREEFGAVVLSASQIVWMHVDCLNDDELGIATNRPASAAGSTGSWRDAHAS